MKHLALLMGAGILWPLAGLQAKVFLGVDVLQKQNFALIQGKRVGLITNHTGRDRKGRSTVEILRSAHGVRLAAIFSPEHGFLGTTGHGVSVADSRDSQTGLPVFSLYGATQRPTEEMLRGLDALVFDIQDVGTRFYTYTTTLAYAMEEAARRGIGFVVLDRPNPVAGEVVEGEPLSPEVSHFTAYLRIPVRHGMTVGEIARWYRRTAGLNLNLTVVPMEGWRRSQGWDETGLRFIPPSPNIRSPEAALLYSGVGCFEATNVSVGRGTERPFEWFGAPWLDGEDLEKHLNFLGLSGLRFKSEKRAPGDDLYKGEVCEGVRIKITDRNAARPLDLFIHAFVYILEKYPDRFQPRWVEVERVTGTRFLEEMCGMKQSAEAILFSVHERAAKFEEERKGDLIYP